MPRKKHLPDVSEKEQRKYEKVKKSAEEEGRYPGREAEVAARTVRKQHKEKGHRKGQQGRIDLVSKGRRFRPGRVTNPGIGRKKAA